MPVLALCKFQGVFLMSSIIQHLRKFARKILLEFANDDDEKLTRWKYGVGVTIKKFLCNDRNLCYTIFGTRNGRRSILSPRDGVTLMRKFKIVTIVIVTIITVLVLTSKVAA